MAAEPSDKKGKHKLKLADRNIWPGAVLLKNRRFSRPQLIIFIIAFALIGFILIKSFAAPNPNLPGDLNNDNTVNVTDMSILLTNYGSSNSTADINSDGTVNVLDLSVLLSHYGQSVSSFSTNLTQGMTITPPFTWTFNPGVATTNGYFFADGVQLAKIAGPGPYTFTIQSSTLTAGSHTLGGSWDLADGTHVTFPQAYSVTIAGSTSGGGSGGGTSSYNTAISYSAPANRPAFSCARTVNVTTASQFTSALSNLQAGDCVINTQTGGFSVPGEITISKSLSSDAMIDLKTGANAVRFTGGGTQYSSSDLPTVYFKGASHIRLYGGDITNDRILIYNPASYITWWNFYAHDLSGDGIDLFPTISGGGDIDHLDIQGEIYHWGINCAVLDPHQEKCTGIHGTNVADNTAGRVTNSRIALYVHDSASGAGMEIGAGSTSGGAVNNTIYLKCVNLTMKAVIQVAGNCVMSWGVNVTGNHYKYIEATNLQGRPYDAQGLYSGASLSTDVVEYGIASNTNLNLSMNESIPQNMRWDTRGGTVFQNVSPLP